MLVVRPQTQPAELTGGLARPARRGGRRPTHDRHRKRWSTVTGGMAGATTVAASAAASRPASDDGGWWRARVWGQRATGCSRRAIEASTPAGPS